MLYGWLGIAMAAGTTPDDRVEVWVDGGVMTSQAALAFGLGAGRRWGAFTLTGTAGFGARGNLFQTGVSQRPGFGLASLAASVALERSGTVSLVGVLDAALLDTIEQDCGSRLNRKACRHYLFWGIERDPKLGVSVQPALGVRVTGEGSSGAAFSTTIGVQPHWLYDNHLWYAPRLDVAIGLRGWSAHAWGGRYGMAIGVGHRLSPIPSR